VSYRAAGLLSIFSLPRLTQLDLGRYGTVWRRGLSTFSSTFTSPPAPLVSLQLPCIGRKAGDDEAADAEAVRSETLMLLSRFPTLRRLSCYAEMASGAVSRADDVSQGCSGSLYSLTVLVLDVRPAQFPFTAPLTFPL
jgi:hypothetical protein